MNKTPGSEVITWSWKQKLAGVSRTCGTIWKIIKLMKTGKKNSKIPKNKNYFTCFLLFRILVTLPNFEMLSHLKKLDLCGLFLIEYWSRSGCPLVFFLNFFYLHKPNLFRRESISNMPGRKPMIFFLLLLLWSVVIISDLSTLKCSHA